MHRPLSVSDESCYNISHYFVIFFGILFYIKGFLIRDFYVQMYDTQRIILMQC